MKLTVTSASPVAVHKLISDHSSTDINSNSTCKFILSAFSLLQQQACKIFYFDHEMHAIYCACKFISHRMYKMRLVEAESIIQVIFFYMFGSIEIQHAQLTIFTLFFQIET